MLDELAAVAKADPVEYRRRLLAKHPRHLGVLNLAAEKAGWGSMVPTGRARGVALHESFGSFVASVAEASIDGRAIRVHRLVTAIDCGTCVNPLAVEAQMEGGVACGLSAPLESELTIHEGRVQQDNFNTYRVLRMSAIPRVEAYIVPSTEPPGGTGEPAAGSREHAPRGWRAQVRVGVRCGPDHQGCVVGNLPPLKPREVVAFLQGLGFAEVRQKGSH